MTSSSAHSPNGIVVRRPVPENELRAIWNQAPEEERYEFLARHFKVSTLVAARRALDLELIDRTAYFEFYRAWEEDERREKRGGKGGSFWNNQNFRVGKRFGTAVVRAVKEGRLPYRDAYALTGLKGEPFNNFVQRFGDSS